MEKLHSADELIGPVEIAERLGVAPRTPYAWRWRGVLPPPVIISGRPLWHWSEIEAWAIRTGRLAAPPQRRQTAPVHMGPATRS